MVPNPVTGVGQIIWEATGSSKYNKQHCHIKRIHLLVEVDAFINPSRVHPSFYFVIPVNLQVHLWYSAFGGQNVSNPLFSGYMSGLI